MDHTAPLTALSGRPFSIMTEALKAGKAAGIVNSGDLVEPGTGCFLASVPSRRNGEEIARQILDSGAQVILCGGEAWLLPEGTAGRHASSGRRSDGLNLLAKARDQGYTVVYDRRELAAVPDTTTKLLGVFAAGHTFNDRSEEALAEQGLPLYAPDAPTLAEMTRAALAVLTRHRQGFLLVVEEEGTDNFANRNNAAGTLEALRRSDEAIGVARGYAAEQGDTLLLTAADSNAGGLAVISPPEGSGGYFEPGEPLPPATRGGAPLDGEAGTGTRPFVAGTDAAGRRLTFGIAWTGTEDAGAGILARADGLNAHLARGQIDNTDIYRVMYLTLFGKLLP
jgi:alkaline phosphatase